MKRQFKGVWIPRAILSAPVSFAAKFIWAEIDSFTGRDAVFFKANSTIGRELGMSERQASRYITELRRAGLVEDVSTNGRTRSLRSVVPDVEDDITLEDEVDISVHPATTDVVSTIPDVSTLPRQIRRVCPTKSVHLTKQKKETAKDTIEVGDKSRPTYDEAVSYFDDLGLPHAEAEKFVDFYSANGWRQKGGNKIKSWKATARNWKRNQTRFNDERKQNKRGFDGGNFTANAAHDFINNG